MLYCSVWLCHAERVSGNQRHTGPSSFDPNDDASGNEAVDMQSDYIPVDTEECKIETMENGKNYSI
jgi:hypothetical protein